MRTGYLYLQTHRDQPQLIRVLTSERLPDTGSDDTSIHIRYIACFRDLDAARMHFHNEQGRMLVDIDRALYQLSLIEAIATIEAIELRHQRIWIDLSLDTDQLQKMQTYTDKFRLRHQRNEILCRAVGAAAVLMLILSALTSMQ